MELKIGNVYGNGKGLFRKITHFTDHNGSVSLKPIYIHWIKCNENGAVFGKERECWVSTFLGWAKQDLGPLGHVEE